MKLVAVLNSLERRDPATCNAIHAGVIRKIIDPLPYTLRASAPVAGDPTLSTKFLLCIFFNFIFCVTPARVVGRLHVPVLNQYCASRLGVLFSGMGESFLARFGS